MYSWRIKISAHVHMLAQAQRRYGAARVPGADEALTIDSPRRNCSVIRMRPALVSVA